MTKIAGSGSGIRIRIRDPDPNPFQRHRSADPDPPQNVMDPQYCLLPPPFLQPPFLSYPPYISIFISVVEPCGNDLLPFRFRIQTIFTKKTQNLAFSMSEAAYFPESLASNFFRLFGDNGDVLRILQYISAFPIRSHTTTPM
jgi:hypothetical protein